MSNKVISNEEPLLDTLVPPVSSPMELRGDNSLVAASPFSFNTIPAEASQPTGFLFFKKLPYEVRKMIWIATAPNDRVVQIDSKDMRVRHRYENQFRSKTRVPVLLHVNLESRSVGLGIYEPLCFGNMFTGTYINWERDFVFFSTYLSRWRGEIGGLDHFSKSTKQYKGQLINEELKKKCRKIIIESDCDTELVLASVMLENLECIVTTLGIGEDDGDMELVPITGVDLAGYAAADFHRHYLEVEVLRLLQKRIPSIKDVQVMIAIKHPFRGLKRGDRTRIRNEKIEFLVENGIAMPKEPVRTIFKNDKVASLRAKAKIRGLSKEGLKKDLLERLEAAEDVRLEEAMKKYESDLVDYWKVMEGYKQVRGNVSSVGFEK